MTFRITFTLSFLVAVATYITMLTWTLPAISAAAGGMIPFDMRPTGYSAEQARAFLATLTSEGRALYTGPQRWLDLVFPGAQALAMGLVFHRIGGWFAKTGMLCAGLGVLFDYIENIAVAALLAADSANISTTLISRASTLTQLKSAMVMCSMAIMLALTGRWAWRHLRRSKP